METIKAAPWLTKAAAMAAVALVGCAAITPMLDNVPQLPTLTKLDGAQPMLKRYAREPIPDTVLLGSSFTHRLYEEYFLPTRLRNLGISGGSGLTGVEIVESYARLPQLILIEANVMSRDHDADLVNKYRSDAAPPVFLRPLRVLAAYLNFWQNGVSEPGKQIARKTETLLTSAPSEYDNSVYIDRAWEEMTTQHHSDETASNVAKLDRIVSAIEARGSRVYFYELPYAAPLGNSNFAVITRAIMHKHFSDPARWLDLTYPADEMRFADGVHLDERSAVIVAHAIRRVLPTLNPAHHETHSENR